MKIIDLLNKIANGGELPKKIKYEENIWKLNTLESTYDNGKCCLFEDYIDKKYVITDVLNDEVEIIEDKKIEKLNKQIDITKFANEYKEVAQCLTNFSNKINEIIDYINKGDN